MSHKDKHRHSEPPSPAAAGQAPQPDGAGPVPPTQPPGEPAAPQPAAAPPEAAALQAQRDDLLRRLQRVSADYLNYQKRIQKEIHHAREFANEELLKAILPVLDDVDKALEAGAANHPTDDPLLAGLRLIQEKALSALGPFGLAPIRCLGEPFDPDRHSAVVQEPTAEHPPNTVVRELRKGYAMKGRTLRAAMVTVSVKPEEKKEGTTGDA